MKKVFFFGVSIFLSLFFVSHVYAIGVVAEQPTVHGTSTIVDLTWSLVVNETTTTEAINVSQINLWLYYTTSSNATIGNIQVKVLDDCGDYRSDLVGFGNHTSTTIYGTFYNTDLIEINKLKYYQFRSISPYTLPAGYCYILQLNAYNSVHVGGNKVNNTTGEFAGGDLGYIINNSAPPYQSGALVKDAFYVVCDEFCLYLDPDISPVVETTTNLVCDDLEGGLFSTVSVKYVACVFLVPSLGKDYLMAQIADLTTYFPFNIMVDFASSVSAYADNYTTSSQSLTLSFASPVSMDISITSSTMATGNFGSIFSTVRTYLDLLIWLLLGFAILAVVIAR